jgi:uncharacterized Zn-finger protein
MNKSNVNISDNFFLIKKSDLPFSCPQDEQNAWSHPKVFLNFDKKNIVSCPYCCQKYKLT